MAVMYATKHPGHVPFVTVHSSRFTMDGIRATLEPQEAESLAQHGSFEYREFDASKLPGAARNFTSARWGTRGGFGRVSHCGLFPHVTCVCVRVCL